MEEGNSDEKFLKIEQKKAQGFSNYFLVENMMYDLENNIPYMYSQLKS